MRTTTIPQQTVVEAIQSVNYHINSYVDALVGIGQMVDGEFTFSIPQQFDDIKIMDKPAIFDPQTNVLITPEITDFTDLITQYPGGSFTSDDLWPYIDRVRARRQTA